MSGNLSTLIALGGLPAALRKDIWRKSKLPTRVILRPSKQSEVVWQGTQIPLAGAIPRVGMFLFGRRVGAITTLLRSRAPTSIAEAILGELPYATTPSPLFGEIALRRLRRADQWRARGLRQAEEDDFAVAAEAGG